MFLCDPCHKKGDCPWDLVELLSRGRCENCGETAVCVDCHHYDFRQGGEG
jgi:hypothetical protein